MATDINIEAEPLGLYIQPGWGTAYPQMKTLIKDIILKAANIPWLSQGWKDAALDIDKRHPGDVLRVQRIFNASGVRYGNNLPKFLDTPEKQKFWDELAKKVDAAVVLFAQNQAKAGAAELAILNAKAAFWDGAYKFAVAVRDAPKTVIGAAGDVASGIVSETLKKFAIPLIVVAIGFIVWTQRDALSRAAVKRVA
jgi:hypothetical protein